MNDIANIWICIFYYCAFMWKFFLGIDMWNEVYKNNRMYNDMRFLNWHQHLVLWAKSHVPCLLNSIKYQFLPRRQHQARGWTDAHLLATLNILKNSSLWHHCSNCHGKCKLCFPSSHPWTSQSGKCAWPEVLARARPFHWWGGENWNLAQTPGLIEQ